MFRSFALLLVLGSFLPAQQLPVTLDRRVQSSIRDFPAKVFIYAKHLASGATYSLNGDAAVRTASTIKLPIMIECFAEAAEGKINLHNDQIELVENEKVSGSGILQDLSNGIHLPMRDLIELMIVLSDNTATNLVLNRIGGNAVNARMESLGLVQTRCMRKVLRGDTASGVTAEGAKPENKRWGLGRSSPHEMVALLEKLNGGELVNKQSSEEMIKILKQQRERTGIARDLRDVTVANKSGALDHLRSDVGIVWTKGGPIAMAITVDDVPEVNWTPDNPALLLISELSQILIDELPGRH
jgi:beta-lactamase class A